MRIACWTPKATNAHTVCVIFIAFLLQQWLHERASMLRYTFIVCPVVTKFSNSFKNRGTFSVRYAYFIALSQ